MKTKISLTAAAVFFCAAGAFAARPPKDAKQAKIYEVKTVLVAPYSGVITPAAAEFIEGAVDKVNGAGGADLLDYTVNYAATADADSGLFFAVKGLVGAYPGQFATIPYYLKIQEYHNIENRDLWEFPLNLKPEEIDRLLEKVSRLGQGGLSRSELARLDDYAKRKGGRA